MFCEVTEFVISLFYQVNKCNQFLLVSVSLPGFHDSDDMYLMINSKRRGLSVGEAKIRKKRKVGEIFVKSVTAPSPQHVKEGLLSANRLCLLHPEEDIISENKDMRDTAMEVMYKNNSQLKVLKNNSVTTVNNQILKTFVETLSVSFLMDNCGPVTTAPKEWSTTSEEV